MDKPDYEISVTPLIDPIGDFRYVAKVSYFAGLDGKAAPGFGESYGRTEAEAKAKIRERVDAWIAERSK